MNEALARKQSPYGRKRLLLFAGPVLALSGAALANTLPVWIGDFKYDLAGWTIVRIDKKVPATRFEPVSIGGVNAVQASADKSMALLTRKVIVDLQQTPILCWQWRVSNALKAADITRKTGDDQAARIYVGLMLPASSMSFGTRTKLAMARSTSGAAVPDGVINYVWDNQFPVGTVRPNVYTDRARVIVMQSGNGEAGKWVSERRNVALDIEKQFKTSAGRISSVAISSDTDNTGEKVTAAFANLHMVGQSQACKF